MPIYLSLTSSSLFKGKKTSYYSPFFSHMSQPLFCLYISPASSFFRLAGWDSAPIAVEQSPALDVVAIGLADGRFVLHPFPSHVTTMTSPPFPPICISPDPFFSLASLRTTHGLHMSQLQFPPHVTTTTSLHFLFYTWPDPSLPLRIALHNLKYDRTVLMFAHDQNDAVCALTFRTDGEPWLVSASRSGTLHVWNLSQKMRLASLEASTAPHPTPPLPNHTLPHPNLYHTPP